MEKGRGMEQVAKGKTINGGSISMPGIFIDTSSQHEQRVG